MIIMCQYIKPTKLKSGKQKDRQNSPIDKQY